MAAAASGDPGACLRAMVPIPALKADYPGFIMQVRRLTWIAAHNRPSRVIDVPFGNHRAVSVARRDGSFEPALRVLDNHGRIVLDQLPPDAVKKWAAEVLWQVDTDVVHVSDNQLPSYNRSDARVVLTRSYGDCADHPHWEICVLVGVHSVITARLDCCPAFMEIELDPIGALITTLRTGSAVDEQIIDAHGDILLTVKRAAGARNVSLCFTSSPNMWGSILLPQDTAIVLLHDIATAVQGCQEARAGF